MARRPKDIGTEGENRVLERFVSRVWPNAGRGQAQGIYDYGDFFNTKLLGMEMLNEVKNTKTWSIPAWLRTIYKQIERRTGFKARELQDERVPWALWFKQRPMRDLPEDLCLMPSWLATELLLCYTEVHGYE